MHFCSNNGYPPYIDHDVLWRVCDVFGDGTRSVHHVGAVTAIQANNTNNGM